MRIFYLNWIVRKNSRINHRVKIGSMFDKSTLYCCMSKSRLLSSIVSSIIVSYQISVTFSSRVQQVLVVLSIICSERGQIKWSYWSCLSYKSKGISKKVHQVPVSSMIYRARSLGSYVTEREKDDCSWDSSYTPSAIWTDVLSQLHYKRHLMLV
jgi:hypothetical protein